MDAHKESLLSAEERAVAAGEGEGEVEAGEEEEEETPKPNDGSVPLPEPEDEPEHPDATPPPPPKDFRFDLSDKEMGDFVQRYVLAHDSTNFDLIPDALEKKAYVEVIKAIQTALNTSVAPALVQLQKADIAGHHVEVVVTKAGGLEVEGAFNDHVSRQCVDEFVKGLLKSKDINFPAVPDAVERAIYRNVLILVMQLLRHLLSQIKIVFLDHELTIAFDPTPHFTPAPFKSNLDHHRVSETVHKLLKKKNAKWVPDSIEYYLHFTAYVALLSLLEHVFESMDVTLLTTRINLRLSDEPSGAKPKPIGPPPEDEVDEFIQKRVLDSDHVNSALVPDVLEHHLYSLVVWAVLEPVLAAANTTALQLSQVDMWEHSLKIDLEAVARVPDKLFFNHHQLSRHVNDLVNEFMATKFDLAIVPDSVERALYVNCLTLAMELLHHLLSQVNVNLIGHRISFRLQAKAGDPTPPRQPSLLSRRNIHAAADKYAKKHNSKWVPDSVEQYLTRSVLGLILAWVERAMLTSRVRLIGWEFESRLVPTKGYVKDKPKKPKKGKGKGKNDGQVERKKKGLFAKLCCC